MVLVGVLLLFAAEEEGEGGVPVEEELVVALALFVLLLASAPWIFSFLIVTISSFLPKSFLDCAFFFGGLEEVEVEVEVGAVPLGFVSGGCFRDGGFFALEMVVVFVTAAFGFLPESTSTLAFLAGGDGFVGNKECVIPPLPTDALPTAAFRYLLLVARVERGASSSSTSASSGVIVVLIAPLAAAAAAAAASLVRCDGCLRAFLLLSSFSESVSYLVDCAADNGALSSLPLSESDPDVSSYSPPAAEAAAPIFQSSSFSPSFSLGFETNASCLFSTSSSNSKFGFFSLANPRNCLRNILASLFLFSSSKSFVSLHQLFHSSYSTSGLSMVCLLRNASVRRTSRLISPKDDCKMDMARG
mmetsp:Transcript_31992/g.67713  ORF Transcript_31992/g.67713 Transcript_31992/m.67713 type:complete len:359 (-) Transcript_31992:336-1412(-)